MNVIILHQYFNTPEKGGPLRSYYLAKALVDRRIDVIVISGYNGSKIKEENVEGIRILYLPVAYDNRFGFYERGSAFLKYVFAAVKHARKFRDADLCYAISAPMTTGLAAWMMKILYNIPYIFEVGDLWPDAPIQMGFVRNIFLKWSLFRLEKLIYSGAILIVALSEEIKRRIEQKIPNKKIHVIPNMADVDYFSQPLVAEVAHYTARRQSGMFTVSYVGALGFANGVEYIVDCARHCHEKNLPVHFFICGDGARKEPLKNKARESQIPNITWIDFQNREGVKHILEQTDAVFISFLNKPILETGCPHKYTDGLAAGKLIILNFGGWIRTEIETEKCGVFVDPRNSADFAQKIQPFLESKVFLAQYQSASRKLGETKYSRGRITDQFSKIILSAKAT